MTNKKIAVIGGGPAGFIAAISAAENCSSSVNPEIYIYEKHDPLKTILYTGNGRCNLSNNLPDFKELAQNYPRGEKFLYSVFSRFGVQETIDFFNNIGLETYIQSDNRIFPKTDKASSVMEFLLKKALEHGIKLIKGHVKSISTENNMFSVRTDTSLSYYEIVIAATGGNKTSSKGYELFENIGHGITKLKPSLTSFITEEKWVKNLAGVTVKNAQIESLFENKIISKVKGDFVFTHKGVSGPAIFDISSYCAYIDYLPNNPLILRINFIPDLTNEELIEELSPDSEKSISNDLKKYVPKSLAEKILKNNEINPDKKLALLSIKETETVISLLQNTKLKVISPAKDGEIVTAGGIDLKEVDSRTMESKIVKNLFFCGEVLDIDGLTGGFNLQMCWSTGYIAGLNASSV